MAARLWRVYDRPWPPGEWILVDRLWPRGLSRAAAPLSWWAREVAPSTDLRRWYGHVPERYAAFRERYLAELAESDAAGAALSELVDRARTGDVVLLTATRDLEHSGARVLYELLLERGVSPSKAS